MLSKTLPDEFLSEFSLHFSISKLIINTTQFNLYANGNHQGYRTFNTAPSYENVGCVNFKILFFRRMDAKCVFKDHQQFLSPCFKLSFLWLGERVLRCIIQLWIVKACRVWLALHTEKKRDPGNISRVTFLQEINWIE